MGKTAKWFRGLLGGATTTKKSHPHPTSDATSSSVPSKPQPPPRKTNKWSFVGSYRDKHAQPTTTTTAKSTGSGRLSAVERDGMTWREVVAAVRIQAVFRGYLARRALKALKGVVKLQALVRGHITRKKKAEEMRCMQALLRLQSKARASRLSVSELSQQPGPTTPEKHERTIRSKSTRHSRPSLLKRNSSVSNNRDSFDWERPQLPKDFLDRRIDEHAWDYYCRETRMKYGLVDDNQSNKNGRHTKPDFNTKHQNISAAFNRLSFEFRSKDSTTANLSSSSVSSGEVQSNWKPKPVFPEDETFCTSATSRHSSTKRGPFTPTTTSDSRSFQSLCTDHPNYMSNTESSRAKARSQSAPKQRLEFEKSSSARRYGAHGSGDMRRNMLKASVVQSSFANKGYPGSGRLDRLGVASQIEFSDAYDNRY